MSYWDEAMREAYEEAYPCYPSVGIIGDSGRELMLPLDSHSVTLSARNIFGTREGHEAIKEVTEGMARRRSLMGGR